MIQKEMFTPTIFSVGHSEYLHGGWVQKISLEKMTNRIENIYSVRNILYKLKLFYYTSTEFQEKVNMLGVIPGIEPWNNNTATKIIFTS